MANRSGNPGSASGRLVARLGRLLTGLIAGEDMRVRQVIAQTVTRARAARNFDAKTRRHIRHDPAANSRVE
jgi:hypothetical protein